MYQYKGLEDTIAAIATPLGQGGIGIIRISGRYAVAMADKVVRLKDKFLAEAPSHTVHYGKAVDPKSREIIDDVLVTLMRSPKSYTAEDVVEISGHGGMAVLRAVLEAVLAAGARLAEPGEFTKRAFVHGRLDLTQAEAVLDIINARTSSFLRQSRHQLQGELSTRLKAVREELMNIYTMVEALINFPEDEIEAQSRRQLAQRIAAQEQAVTGLLETSHTGRILREGIRLVLCGKPNVGKSSLLNALLKQERAIVTDIAGTTRDVLEEPAQIRGVPISLVDTAGILEPRDLIEQEAVSRSRLFIQSADVVLLVLDNSRPLEQQDRILMEQLQGSRVLVVVNKMDLNRQIDAAEAAKRFGDQNIVEVSALKGQSIQRLEDKIFDIINQAKHLDTGGILVSNLRHIKALEEAQKNLQDAGRLMKDKTSLEFVSEDIKSAVNQLDAITGRNIDADLLDRIFSEFCIGK